MLNVEANFFDSSEAGLLQKATAYIEAHSGQNGAAAVRQIGKTISNTPGGRNAASGPKACKVSSELAMEVAALRRQGFRHRKAFIFSASLSCGTIN